MTQEDEPTTILDPVVDIDQESQVPITRIEEAPVPLGGINNWLKEGRNLKFEINPIDNSGVIYISANESKITNLKLFPEESKLYSFQIPDSINDDSEEYYEYLKSCFKNFEELIKDMSFRDFITTKVNENRIGVILEEDINARKLQNHENQIFLNSTISKLISDLGILIDTKLSVSPPLLLSNEDDQQKEENPDDFKLIQLEETMNVLGLINALFFATADEVLVLMINWVNRADIQPDLDFTELIFAIETPFKHRLFWSEYIMKLVTRGLFAQAVNVINESKYESLQDEEDENDLFLIIEDLIVLLSSYDTVQFSYDNRRFVHWKQKCCELRDNFMNVTINNKENIPIKNNIYEILLVMTGLQSSIIKHTVTWYECLLAKLLFELPSQSLINGYLDTSLAKFPVDEMDSMMWERICIDLLHGNYLKVVKGLEVLDKLTSTYVSILFEAKGLYNSYDQLLSDDNNNIEEEEEYAGGNKDSISGLLLNDHALECLCHQSLIPIGVGILMNMNTSITRSIIGQYLPKFHCNTNDDLEWCLSICAKLKLQTTAATILKINGNRLFEQGQIYELLTLFSKSGDLQILQEKCWLILENSLMRSEKISDELINGLILNPSSEEEEFQMPDSLRQCLSPYAIFLMFLKFKRENQFSKLILYLLRLISFPYLPQKFFPLLISQLLPFFKNLSPTSVNINPSKGKILTQPQLIQLLELINNFDQSFFKNYEVASKTVKPTVDQQLIIIEFENCQDLYKLCISESYMKQIKDKQYDWRFQMQLIDGENGELPLNIKDLMLYVRGKISLQIGWCFLEEI